MDIQQRLKCVIAHHLPKEGRFSRLEELTGIPANSWKAVWYDRQRPTMQMFEAVGLEWPTMALWLLTGVCDAIYGYVEPDYDGKRRVAVSKPWTERFLKSKIALSRFCEENGIDNERILSEMIGVSVPKKLIDDIRTSSSMRNQEIDFFRSNPDKNWEPEWEPGQNCEEETHATETLPDFTGKK